VLRWLREPNEDGDEFELELPEILHCLGSLTRIKIGIFYFIDEHQKKVAGHVQKR